MRFDATINLGHVCIIVGFLVSGTTAYYGIRDSINNHEWRLNQMEVLLKDQTSVNRQTGETLALIGRDLAVIRARSDTEPLKTK